MPKNGTVLIPRKGPFFLFLVFSLQLRHHLTRAVRGKKGRGIKDICLRRKVGRLVSEAAEQHKLCTHHGSANLLGISDVRKTTENVKSPLD